MALNNGTSYLPTAGEGMVPQWPGVYAGTVINNHDPLGVGRLQLNVPQVLGNAVSAWAVPAGTYYAIPTNGTPVSVTFLGGDPAQPLWNGPLDLNPLVESAAGPNVTYSVSQPPNPKVGDIWYPLVNGIQGPPAVWTFNSGSSTYSWVTQPSTGSYGTNGNFLVYSGVPAVGNLIASTSAIGGTDALGNLIQAGVTSYNGNPSPYVSLFGGQVNFDNGAYISEGGNGLVINGTAPNTNYINSFLPFSSIIAAVKPGTTATADGWNTATGLNSFTLAPSGFMRFQYKLHADSNVEIAGCIQLPGTFSGVTFFQMPNGYRPNAVVQWPYTTQQGLTISSDGTGAVQCDTSGNLTLRNNPTGLGSGNVVFVAGRYALGTL